MKQKGEPLQANIYHKPRTLTNLASYVISPKPYQSLEYVMP